MVSEIYKNICIHIYAYMYLIFFMFMNPTSWLQWDITIISLVIIFSFMILRRQRWSQGLIIFLLIDVIFIMSFFITWWRLIQVIYTSFYHIYLLL